MPQPAKIIRAFGVWCCLWLAGCLQDENLIKVKSDGSGVFTETVTFGSALLEQMKAMAGATKVQSPNPGQPDEAKLRARATELGEGVTFVSAEKVKTDRGEGYRVTYAFADINKLKFTSKPPNPMGGSEDQKEPGEPAEKPMIFRFTKGKPATLVITMPQEEKPAETKPAEAPPADASTAAMQEAMLPMIMQMFRDMKMTVVCEFEGQIVDTTAKFRDASRITLIEVDFNKLLADPANVKEMAKVGDMDSAEGKALIAKMPGVKVDQAKTIQVRFQ